MDYNLIRKEQVSSTNSYLSDLIKQGNASCDTIVIADYQTDGRGQEDNGWESKRGENLLLSWLIRPAVLSASEQFMISKVVSLALIDHLDAYVGNACIKWPNDILIGNRKIAGILIEHTILGNSILHSVAGIGLNINQADFPSFHVPATSLYKETGRQYDLEKQMRKLIRALYNRLSQLQEGQSTLLDNDYVEHLFRYRQRVVFKSGKNHFEATVEGINEFGQLLLKESGRTRSYNFGEVQLLIH